MGPGTDEIFVEGKMDLNTRIVAPTSGCFLMAPSDAAPGVHGSVAIAYGRKACSNSGQALDE